RLTYAQLDARARAAAGALHNLGLRQGDRFGVLGRNCVEFVAIFFGSLKLGTIVVPLSTRATEHERAQIAEDCGMKLVVELEVAGRGLQSQALLPPATCDPRPQSRAFSIPAAPPASRRA